MDVLLYLFLLSFPYVENLNSPPEIPTDFLVGFRKLPYYKRIKTVESFCDVSEETI
jgi:hypothetical protein